MNSKQTVQRARVILLALSALLCIALMVCYWFQPDICTAVTVFPVWLWFFLALPWTLLGLSRTTKRQFVAVAVLWLLYLTLFCEELRSLLRFRHISTGEWQSLRRQGKALRIVSLNCAGGSEQAADEVLKMQPDIVLLQESPSRQAVEQLAYKLFGKDASVLWGVDASIMARGTIVPVDLPSLLDGFCVHGSIRLTSGLQADVVSIRLLPNLVRMDLWSPNCWRAYKENRQARREQLRAVMQHLDETVSHDTPLIVGGDFNAPQCDAIFRLMRPRLHDAFAEGGIGWGNTMLNELPVVRIDQIWVSKHFRAVAVIAVKTLHSDHRMVVCDLVKQR